MKKHVYPLLQLRPVAWLLVVASLFPLVSFHSLCAQTVREDSFQRLMVDYRVPELRLQSQILGGTKMQLLTIDGYRSGGRVGAPALPIRSDLIVVPFCDSIVVTVTDVVYDTFHFPLSTFLSHQRPRSKSPIGSYKVDFDSALYAIDTFYGLPLATVTPAGIARDRRLASLRFSPLRVNPVTGEAILCRSATVTLTYIGADASHTLDYYRRYHTPAYTVGTTLNRLFTAKDASLSTPLRMIIAVGEGLSGCGSLNDFVSWKRSQGLKVDFLYADSIAGFTSTLLEDTLRAIYHAATPDNPAPLYVVLVGDHEQLPASDNRLDPDNWVFYDHFNPHITDHYFAYWTSDNIRDCYLGRFSATSNAELAAIIDKTLFYERYLFSDDSYLAKAVLVSGVDAGTPDDWAYNYADPSMDYVTLHYLNSDHRFSQVTYAKNNILINPGAPGVSVMGNGNSATLRSLYNEGVGFANYSAHGSATSWSNPLFDVTQVNAMSNLGKPSVMIGNCCLTNHFQTPLCFGEALLRKASGGAAAYIGATNNTYWDDDFFYSVGYRAEVDPSMSLVHNPDFTGSYDHHFHLHGEAPAVTVGAVMHAGLMSVNSILDLDEYGPSMVPYYWEIYELMGDPSLIPWMGQATNPSFVIDTTGANLIVRTLPGAYVALVDSNNLRLLGAAFADASGVATLTLGDTAGSLSMLSITAQQQKPYYRSLRRALLGIDHSPLSTFHSPLIYPNPFTDNVVIEGLPAGSTVELYDPQGRRILTTNNSRLITNNLPAGLYLLRIITPAGTHIERIIKQ